MAEVEQQTSCVVDGNKNFVDDRLSDNTHFSEKRG